jgi:hypothetical protein
VTEERKFAILFTATLLAARKLIDMDPNKPNRRRDFSCIVLSRTPLPFSNGLMHDGLRL